MKLTLAALALVAALVATASPAAAHNPNPYATWACGATRDHEEDVLIHSHVETLTPTHLTASCEAGTQGVTCNWTAILWWNGHTTGVGMTCTGF